MNAYERLCAARKSGRPTARKYIEALCDRFFELHGDRLFADDPAILGGIAELDGTPVTVIGIEKGEDTKEKITRNFGSPNPEGYRKALRLMKQAEKFHRPVLCFVDTAGAYCGLGAEERGQAYILQCCTMLALRLHLAAAGGAEPPDAAEARAALLPRRDATLLLTFDAARAYYAALCGAEEQIPPSFAQHTLADARMLDVAKPMLGMVETQVWLAQGAWRRAVAQAEALLAPCQTLHYALVRLHLLIQLAAAYARLDDRAAADAHLRQALAEAEPDGLVMPFAENYRDLRPVLDGLAADSAFLREIRTHGAAMESRISALRHGGGEPDSALTARERELAELVAQRLSNREIAERMYLSEGTVKQYVNRIYAKLGIEGSGRQSKRQALAVRMAGKAPEAC